MLHIFKNRAYLLLIIFAGIAVNSHSQQIIDSCFSSTTIGTGFTNSTNLVSLNGDLMQWNGSSWTGGWPSANTTIAPPSGGSGCRAIWCGSGTVWTTGGEGFAMRLNAPLVAGQTYTYNFTTVSHGVGSNGSFSPRFYTNTTSSVGGTWVGNLTPAGNTWVTNPFTFTASAAQAGQTWIIIFTGATGSSGFVNNFCSNCNIQQIPTCNVDLGPDLNLCPGQSALLNATTANATYLWSNGATSPTISVTSAGTYSVTINVNGCTDTDAVTVNYGVNPSVNLGPDVTFCAPQSLSLNATFPSSTYLWQNGSTSPTFTVTQSGTYTVAVTNSCGTATDNIVVNYITPSVNLGPDLSLCPGQTSTLNATTIGATYLWSDNSTGPTLTVNQAGTYTVTTNVGGCTANDAVTVVFGVNPAVNLGPDTTFCSPQATLLDASFPNANFLWQDGTSNPTFLANQPGTYSVSVTNSCGTVSDAIVINYAIPSVNLGPDFTICLGQSATLDATTSGANYLWSDNSTNATLTVTQAGSYSVIATINGCSSADTVIVTTDALPTVNLGPDLTLCSPQSATLDASFPNVNYLWQDNSTNAAFTATQTGSYHVALTNNCGTVSDTVQITINSTPSVDFGPDISICSDQSISLDATSPNADYMWQDNSTNATFTVTQTGTYSVLTSNGNCSDTDTITITVIDSPTVNLGNDTTFCEGGSIILNATNANCVYLWQNNSSNASYLVNQTGTYSVSVSNSLGCVATDTINVIVNPIPIVFAGNDVNLCQVNPISLNASGANSYSWNNGVQNGVVFTPAIGSTTYTVTGTNAAGCVASDDITVTIATSPEITFIADVTSGCVPLNVNLTNTTPGASNCIWTLSDGTTITGCGTVSVVLDQEGCFDVTLTNEFSNGCFGSTTELAYLCAQYPPIASFNTIPQQITATDPIVSFNNNSIGANSYSWDFGDTTEFSTLINPVHAYPFGVANSYPITLIATSSLGCSDTAYSYVQVLEELIYYVPNSFTPDGDMHNQTFQPVFTSGFDPFNYRFRIFNRWGELIFESANAAFGWDGSYTLNGYIFPCQSGVYTWSIEFKSPENDEKQVINGHVNVLR